MSVNLSQAPHGTIHQGLSRFGDRVTAANWQQNVINDDITRSRVEAVLRGESIPTDVSFDQILEREVNIVTKLCGEDWMQYGAEGVVKALEQQIEAALRKIEETWGAITIHDRIIPAGLRLDRIFTGMYAYNAHNPDVPIKLGYAPNEEWWRSDRQIEHIPTTFGVIRQDLDKIMRATNIDGHPFWLSLDDQINIWSKSQGGDGITTTEETMWMWLRSLYERNKLLWDIGSCRTATAYGSSSSLYVYFSAPDGLSVYYFDRDPYWSIGAAARKYLVVG